MIYDNVFIFTIGDDYVHWTWDGDIVVFDPCRTLINIERPDLAKIDISIKEYVRKTINNSVLM